MSLTFSPSVLYTVGPNTSCVAVGDFNADGRKDLATCSNQTGQVSVLLGSGNGTFQGATNFNALTGLSGVAVGDFNADGRQDLVAVGTSTNSHSLLLGNGDGTFQPRLNFDDLAANSVTIGDLNADSKLDLVMSHTASVTVALGKGNGTFQASVSYATGTGTQSVAIADFNADGRPDLATGNYSSGTVSVLPGNGNGTFQPAVSYPAGSGTTEVVAKDLNGDGRVDLVATNVGGNNASVFMGNGNGTLQPAVQYVTGSGPFSAVIADFNLDGNLDLATANLNVANVGILPGSGNGTFQSSVSFGTVNQPWSMAAADFNGDGRPDLVTANINTSTVSVLLNTSGLNAPPTITRTLAAVSVNEGLPATNTGTFDDPQGRSTVTLTASLGTVTKNDAAGTWSWSHTPTDQTAAPVTVTITATDAEGAFSTATFTLATSNVAPTITGFNVPVSANEGGSTMLVAVASDPAGVDDPLTFTWTVTRPDATTATLVGSSISFPFGDNGNYGVRLAVTDGDGGAATRTATIAVANVAPTITAYTVQFTGNEGSPVAFSALAFDPAGASDPLVYTWTITKPDVSTSTFTGASGNFVPADQGNYSVVLRVTDDDGGQFIRPASTVVVSNVAPTILGFTVPSTGTEGSAMNFNVAATDPAGANDPLTYAWTVTPPTGAATILTGANPSFTPTDNGSYGVSLNVSDGDGGNTVRTGSIAIANVAPTINTFILAPTGAEGTPISFTATATDPAGASDPLTYAWTVTHPGGATTNLTGATPSFTPPDNGTYGVSLTVSDGDGGTAVRTGSVAVTNVAPTIITFTVPTTGAEGAVVGLTAAATDPAGASDPLTYAWTITRPNGSTTSLTGANPSLVLTDNGIHGVSLTVSDGDGGTATRTASITVSNVAPTINTFTVPTAGNEGNALNLSAVATDAAGPFDPLSYAWTITRPDASTTTLTGANSSFTPTDNGNYGVSLTVSDGDGGTATRTGSIAVANVAPTPAFSTTTFARPGFESPIASPTLPTTIVTSTISAIDPSSVDQAAGFEYRINWGDGSPLQIIPRVPGNGGGVSVSHTYVKGGNYTNTLTAIDKDGAIGTTTRIINVRGMTNPLPPTGNNRPGAVFSDESIGGAAPEFMDDLVDLQGMDELVA